MTQAQQLESKAAMDSAQGPRILRIGILQGGKLVEERLVRKRETVTIGQSIKNTFVVPSSQVLSRSFALFELTSAGYALNFTETMDGRIAVDENVPPVTLAQLRASSDKRGEVFHVLLSERARGRVVLGDVTVLFQLVPPPPVPPRPQLPPSVRGSLVQELDRVLTAIVAVSLIAHGGFVGYLRGVDFPQKPDIGDIPDRFVQMIVPKKKEEPRKPKVDPNAAKRQAEQRAKEDARKRAAEAAADREASRASAADKGRDPEAAARAAAERRAKLAAQVRNFGVLKMLGAKGPGGGGTVADLLRGGDTGSGGDAVFAQVGGVSTAGGGGSGGGGLSAKGASAIGTTRGIAGLRGGSGPAEVTTGEKGGEKVPRGIIKDARPEAIDGSLSADVVASTIRSRKSAVVACYERALKRNPGLSGKIVLRFTISTVGKVTSVDIEDDTLNDGEVSSCIKNTVRGWRFPAAEGGEVSFSYPFIFAPSG